MSHLITELENNILSITLNNIAKHNAFDDALLSDLYQVLSQEKKIQIYVYCIKSKWSCIFCWCRFSLDATRRQLQRRRKYC